MYDIKDLIYLMSRLRDPEDGCPWDIKQSFDSITHSTLEEAYELVDALEQKDMSQVKEELGDLLLQIMFYAQMGDEKAFFNFEGIVDVLVTKLIRRHPHVFPNGNLQDRVDPLLQESDVLSQWEDIKQQERTRKELTGVFDDIPKALPALARAGKIQKRMSKVGFDWDTLPPVIEKLHEETQELQDAITQGDKEAIENELGDVLFSCVNLARHLKLDPEKCLRLTNQKVERRFTFIETELDKEGVNLEDASQEAMESLWKRAKAGE